MVAIDTDVLLLAYAFHRDERSADNARFLERVQAHQPAVTIYSVMELLGQLSFNLAPARLRTWPSWLQDRYGLTVLYPLAVGVDAETFFVAEIVDCRCRGTMEARMPFLDALIMNLIETAPDITAFVTWNACRFRGKTPLPVLTPAQYVAAA